MSEHEKEDINYDSLKKTFDVLKEEWVRLYLHQQNFACFQRINCLHRVSRSLSWLKDAEQKVKEEHLATERHLAFVLYWISFNATYNKISIDISQREYELDVVKEFLKKIISLDRNHHMISFCRDELQKIEETIRNRYIDHKLWKVIGNRVKNKRYMTESSVFSEHKKISKTEKNFINKTLKNIKENIVVNDTTIVRMLSILFHRFYIYRNQLLHGSITRGGDVSDAQAKQCLSLMKGFMPLILYIMLDNPNKNWNVWAHWGVTQSPRFRKSQLGKFL